MRTNCSPLGLALGSIILLFPSIVSGCMWGPPYPTVCEKYTNSDAIVLGVVGRIQEGNTDFMQRVPIRIERSFKGKLSGTIVLDQPQSTCDWDFSSDRDEKVLVYLKKNKNGKSYHAIGTGYGGRLNAVAGDLYWLKNVSRFRTRTRLSGQVRLYKDEPFTFMRSVSDVPVQITNGSTVFKTRTDKFGVYQFWNLPFGRYKVLPIFESKYTLRFPVELGNIEWKRISDTAVDEKDFEVIISKESRCGGVDYVLNEQDGKSRS